MTEKIDPDQNHTVGGLYIYSDPPGADIYIDYAPIRDATGNIATTPTILTDIPQGLHSVGFKMIGYHDDIVTTEVVGGYYASVYGILLPLPMPTPPT